MQKKTDMSAFLEIENEFDNFDNYDNYNLNLLFIKRIILRSRKQGSPHALLKNSIPSQSIEKFTRQTRIRNLSPDPLVYYPTAKNCNYSYHWHSRTRKELMWHWFVIMFTSPKRE